MSNFFYELKKYTKERLTLNYLLFIPFFLLVLIADGKLGWTSPFAAFIFLFHYRLLEDLSNLKIDKRLHPGRTLSRTSHIKEFNSLLLFLSLLLLYIVFNHSDRFSMKLYLPLLTITSFYRHRFPKLLWFHFHMLKLPLLLLLLGYQNFIVLFVFYSSSLSFEFYRDQKFGESGKKFFAIWISFMLTALLLLLFF
jgi:hypothetical protein